MWKKKYADVLVELCDTDCVEKMEKVVQQFPTYMDQIIHNKTAYEIAVHLKNENLIKLLLNDQKAPAPPDQKTHVPTVPQIMNDPVPTVPQPDRNIPGPTVPQPNRNDPGPTVQPNRNNPVPPPSNAESNKVRNFFDKLELKEAEREKYYNVFVDNGFDDMDVLLQLEEKQFNDIFVQSISIGHRMKIWNSIQNLRTPSTPNPQIARLNRKKDPPTANDKPGFNFLQFVPSAPTDKESIWNCILQWSTFQPIDNDRLLIEELDNTYANLKKTHQGEQALSMVLMWLYSKDSWPYKRMNELLRNDSPHITQLAPMMNGLMRAYRHLNDPAYCFHGVVYRATNLSPSQLSFYKPKASFIWAAFTSTTVVKDPSGNFGKILYQITIPENFRNFALNIQAISVFPEEQEVLLLPNVGYIVEAVEFPTSGPYECLIKLKVSWVCCT